MTQRGKSPGAKAPAGKGTGAGKAPTGKGTSGTPGAGKGAAAGKVSTAKGTPSAGSRPQAGRGGRAAADDRRARAAELRAEQQRKDRRRRLAVVAAIVVIVIAAGGVIAGIAVSQSNKNKIAGLMTYTGLARNHVTTPVKYPQNPPVGGNHNPEWLDCGVYSKPVPNENAVHDLEHGAVWITYQPNLPAAQVTKLRQVVGNQTYLTLSPYPGLPAPVVASAWGKQVRLTGADDGRLQKFIKKFRLGPQTPEPGAVCDGGLDAPGRVQ